MWSGHDPPLQTRALDLERLDDAVGRVFRVGLTLSNLARTLDGQDSERVLQAIAEMDAVIRELRQAAFDGQMQSKVGPTAALWLARIREATVGIDDLLDSGGSRSTTAFDLHVASQAAHRAIIALGAQIDP